MKYLQFDVTESCLAVELQTFYIARLWWYTNAGTVATRTQQFGYEQDAWKWIEKNIKELELAN